MTDNITIHPLKQLFKRAFSAKVALSALISFSVLAQPTSLAEQEWWFDVEVILFERNLDLAGISEKFEQSQLVHANKAYIDVLTPYLHPNLSYLRAGLNYCRASSRQAEKNQYEQDFSFPTPVAEENEPAIPQEREQEFAQVPVEDHSIIVASDGTKVESFQYEVATTDIFSTPEDQNALAEPSELDKSTRFNPALVNGEKIEQPGNEELIADVTIVRPPIQVNFIEWRIPSELPCAYSEQIDPSFASIAYLKEAELNKQSSDLITRVPVVIDGIEWSKKRSAILLPKSIMRLDDLYEKIKNQRDITPIIHLSWRQQVHFGRENGQTIRLYAGQNYVEQFDAQGSPLIADTDALIDSLNPQTEEFYIPEQELALLSPEQKVAALTQINGPETMDTEDIFATIDDALSDDSPINFEHTDEKTKQPINNADSALLKELWQLDGGITVYLRNVGRVPYLHIDSNLDYRQPIYDPKKAAKIQDLPNSVLVQGAIAVNQPIQPNYLQSVNFNQLRRVISKQVHYFDHPLFGMIVQINRYRWPEIEHKSEEEELVAEQNE